MKALKNFYGPVTKFYYQAGMTVSKEDAEACPKGFVEGTEKKVAKKKPTAKKKEGTPKGAKK